MSASERVVLGGGIEISRAGEHLLWGASDIDLRMV